jgi:hypothetical protein
MNHAASSQQPACPWPQTARYPTLDWFSHEPLKRCLCCATATPHRRCHDGGGTTHHESCHESCHESELWRGAARQLDLFVIGTPSISCPDGAWHDMRRWHAEHMQRVWMWGARFRFQAQIC